MLYKHRKQLSIRGNMKKKLKDCRDDRNTGANIWIEITND